MESRRRSALFGHGAIALVGWLLAGSSCGDDASVSSKKCPIGARHCACTRGGACDPGLECIDEICVSAGSHGTAGAGGDPGQPEAGRGGNDGATGGRGGGASGASAAGGGSGGDADGGEPPDVACTPGSPVPMSGTIFQEATDFPDCNSGCTNRYEATPFDIEIPDDQRDSEIVIGNSTFDAVSGAIDGALHAPGDVPDWDFIRVKALPRTLVEVTVEPFYEDSCLDPIVSLFDPNLASAAPFLGLVAQNDARSEGELAARLLIVAPLAEDDAWFVVVDDARNAAGGSVGADSFRYVARFRRLGMATFTEIVLPQTGDVTSVSGELEQAGDVDIYTFHDTALVSHTIRFTTENPEMCGEIWQLNTKNGLASWTTSGASGNGPNGCSMELEFRTNALLGGTDGEYGLVVAESFGRGSNSGAGDFAYTLELVSQP